MPRLRFLLLASTLTLLHAAPPGDIFIKEQSPPDIYHAGWIDLNKNGTKDPYEDPGVDVNKRIDDLLGRMTMMEKTGQMVTLYGYPRVLADELPTEKWLTSFWKDGIGNVDEHINGVERRDRPTGQHVWPLPGHVRALNEVQRFFIEKTRLGIPADFSNEGVRGLAHARTTSFPAQIGLGSTWDSPLNLEIGRVVGREARALGYTNVYSPILDLARDPRWGRTSDCYSEDPFLAAELGMAQVRGIQEQRVVSTLKHFALYSITRGARDGDARTDSQASWNEVQTVHLYPFRKAIRDAGALGVMASYNDYDGIPIESNRLFLTDILRGEYGFKGYVVSDSRAIELIETKHRTAPDHATALLQSIQAGLNVCTSLKEPEFHGLPLRQLAADGRLSKDVIDARVRDVLRVKFWLGLFDQPYRETPEAVDQVVRQPGHMEVAARAVRESLVLLKNEGGVLPLRKDLRAVLVTGPLAADTEASLSRYGPSRLESVSVLSGIRRKLGPNVEVRHVAGSAVIDENFPESDIVKEDPSAKVAAQIEAAVTAAKDVDAVIVVVGENEAISRESASRVSLDLPGYQEQLVRALQKTGVPVVMVLINGRPLSINWAAKHVPAILEAWFPGEMAGDAIADALFGDYNPGGRLPVTVPRSAGHIPVAFPVRFGANGKDAGQVRGVLYPFGHGLSYTTFAYANLRVASDPNPAKGPVQISFDVTNTGARAGDEVAQLYLRDDQASVVGFEQMLRGFERLTLQPKETRRVSFTVSREDLAIYDRTGKWTVEPGSFSVMIGSSSEDIRLKGTFTVDANARLPAGMP